MTDVGDKLEMSEAFLSQKYLFCHQFFGLEKKSEFKKDFTTDENMILQYDDYNQLAEAGQQIIALVQAGCKSRRNTANAGK